MALLVHVNDVASPSIPKRIAHLLRARKFRRDPLAQGGILRRNLLEEESFNAERGISKNRASCLYISAVGTHGTGCIRIQKSSVAQPRRFCRCSASCL